MRAAQVIQACYNRLNTSAVTGLLSSSYGVPAIFQVRRVPRNEAGDALFFPYITIGVPNNANFSDKTALGGNAVVQIDVWDRSGSDLALGDIMDAAELATVRQTWTGLTGFITCERENSDMLADPDGLTAHGLIRLRVLYIDSGNPWSSEFSQEFG